MRALLFLAILAGLAFTGCESALDAPTAIADLSVQARDALEVLPAGADVAAMLNVQAVRESPLGRHAGPFTVEGMSGEGAARFDEFVRLTGFDPERDLTRVYVAVSGTGEDAAPAFVVYGRFDRARMDAYLQDHAPAEAALERTTLGGLPVYLGTDDGRRFGLALVNDEMALAGDEAALRAMIARLEAPGGGLDSDAEMMRLVERAAYGDGAWFAARRLDHDAAHAAHPAGDLARAGGQMAQGVVSFDFRRDGVAMQGVGFPRPGTSAADVADLVRGGVAAMRAQAGDEPAVVRALDGVEVRAAGDAVTVQAVLPQAFLDRMTQAH